MYARLIDSRVVHKWDRMTYGSGYRYHAVCGAGQWVGRIELIQKYKKHLSCKRCIKKLKGGE